MRSTTKKTMTMMIEEWCDKKSNSERSIQANGMEDYRFRIIYSFLVKASSSFSSKVGICLPSFKVLSPVNFLKLK